MDNLETKTDLAVLRQLGERLAAHRLAANKTQGALALEAGVSKRTVVRIEDGESVQLTNLIRVARALGLLGNLDAFVPPPTPSPLTQLRAQAKQRRRASSKRAARKSPGPWSWGEPDSDRGET